MTEEEFQESIMLRFLFQVDLTNKPQVILTLQIITGTTCSLLGFLLLKHLQCCIILVPRQHNVANN